MSCVMYHVSCVMCQLSFFTYHFFPFSYFPNKVINLVGQESVINRSTPYIVILVHIFFLILEYISIFELIFIIIFILVPTVNLILVQISFFIL